MRMRILTISLLSGPRPGSPRGCCRHSEDGDVVPLTREIAVEHSGDEARMSARQAGGGVEAPARLEAIGVQHHHRVWRPGIGEHLSAAHVVPDNTIMRSQTAAPSGRPYHPGDIAHPDEAYNLGG